MQLNARIKHKRDTASNWATKNPTPLDGEIIIVESTDGTTRLKVGDGSTKYASLPFLDEDLATQVSTNTSNITTLTNTKVTGVTSATSGNVVVFDGTGGRLIKDSGKSLSGYLPLDGGTMTGDITFNAKGKGLKWTSSKNNNNDTLAPYIGYCTNSGDGTFVIGSLLGTTYQSGLALGGSSGNLLWKGNALLTTASAISASKVSGTVASADKANKDASGNTITSTYATKTELTSGLGGKSNTDHTHRFYTSLIPYGTQINASKSAPVDLNTVEYMKVGNYFCSSNASAEFITNLPKAKTAFMMAVYSPLSQTVDNETGNWVYRLRKISFYTGEEFIQYCYTNGSGVWTYDKWEQIITSKTPASESVLGAVKVGSNITVSSGTISLTKSNVTSALGYTPLQSYTLPTASSSTLGGVKIGSNITVSSGTISLTKSNVTSALGYTPPTKDTTYSAATSSVSGLMSASDKAKLDGIASGANAYSLPTASSSTLGGVKTTSTVTSTSGLTACPIINGVPYYKDTKNTYTLSSFGVTATASELNVLDGITATTAELNFCDGVTSNIQTQLNGKLSTSGTAAKATADASGNTITSTYATKTELSGKANSATSLSGYGITDAYTKTQSNKTFLGWDRGTLDVDTLYDGGLFMVSSGTNVPTGMVDKYGVCLSLPYRQLTGNTKTDFGAQIFIPNGDEGNKPNSMFYRTSLGDAWNSWQEVATTSYVSSNYLGKTEKASSAVTADSATSATKATQDGSGNVITSTYLKSADASSTYLTKTTADSTYLGITAKAESAKTADIATKATQDGNGATIANTYAKLSGATFTNWIYATGFKVNSDLNLKENLVEIEDALEKCNTLTGYTYNFKDTPNVRHGGLIAQDIQKVLPESVSENSGKLVVDYNGVVALLVEAVKELSAKVEKLEVKCE